jgi:CDP-diacylglycerol--glycerol-3-phosphate 3-phosphatidyltransferase
MLNVFLPGLTEINGDLIYSFVLLSVAAILVLSYAVKSIFRGKAQFDRVDREGGSALLGKGIMEMAYWGLQPVGDFFILLGFTPNAISFLSLFFGSITGIALAFGHFGSAGFFCTICSLLDSVDGMVARKTGKASDSGEVVDAAVDRYVEFFFLAGLIYYYREVPWLVLLTLTALLGSFMVSYSTAKAEALHVTPPRGYMRRTERAVYLTFGAVLAPISIQSFEINANYSSSYGLYPINVGYPMVFALFVVAVFSNWSAFIRLRAVANEVKNRKSSH